ncbi:DeoR/GlpR family DNA-binding transcription regulator [Pseudalkalibacillus salsuginis]|uniref:DeoR/GlpR family DNA-binding transcription regulator n=1 Tax=Pseudalkalibacillus salsuginis TaxID=2910972 RepID=UPI001F45F54F|nr:DeoR/GlpR family DNA-binding transcription regulator [Pseudalkalibacillus salsuginis]MCF6411516.1 DeoR/GlpR family DNA-binding transcription regulator [Pseudalkalibacillus salsuginis]
MIANQKSGIAQSSFYFKTSRLVYNDKKKTFTKGELLFMFMEERKAQILEYLRHMSRASVHDLSQQFNVSESTIRRDLKELEETNNIKRTHGGAILLQPVSYEASIGDRKKDYIAEKQAIAKKAVEFINPGDAILLDSGTTTYELVKELKTFSNLSIVTNSIIIMQELADIPGLDVMLLGGNLRRETSALVGPFAEQSLNMIRIDKAFIGTNGLDLKEGIITTPNLTEARIKRMMITNSRQTILLTDHSKIGKVNFAKVADLSAIDFCIVDAKVQDHFEEEMKRYGVNVHIVKL